MPGQGFWDVRWLATVDSTNRYVLDQARSGAPDRLVVVADHQTAGRGRLGRKWEAPPGTSLLMTVLMRPEVRPSELHLVSTALALAAVEACETLCNLAGGKMVGIKWPNDLVVDDHKLAGVLAESDPDAPGGPPGSSAVVVGLGLNVTWPGPAGAGGTSLAEVTGRVVDRSELLDAVLGGLEPRYRALSDPDGATALAEELRRRCVTLGRRVVVTTGQGAVEGTAVDITRAGHLVVDASDGRHEMATGDVVHVRTAPDPGAR